jgi:hypothetical protein
MSTERRTFRPFDVPTPIAAFLRSARLRIREDADDLVEPFTRRRVDPSDMLAGVFDLVLAADDETFKRLATDAREAAEAHYGSDSVELVAVASSSYLKIADLALRLPFSEAGRIVRIGGDGTLRATRAIHHGCEIEAFLVLSRELKEERLRPWRRGTWLSRARFELRTGLDGVGFNVLPLTDELRTHLGLPEQTLRYIELELSPLETEATSVVNLYVDSELLARLKREPRKAWAKAFTDQLAVDVLTAVAVRALADENLQRVEWSEIEDRLLGALILMLAGRPSGDEEAQRRLHQRMLEDLRTRPQRFLTLIEGAVEMRSSARFIYGGGT